MTQFAATNIMKLMKSEQDPNTSLQSPTGGNIHRCPEFKPIMVPTIGEKAVICEPGLGVSSGGVWYLCASPIPNLDLCNPKVKEEFVYDRV